MAMGQYVFASRHRLIPNKKQQEDAKRVPDGHGRFYKTWPWEKIQKNINSVKQIKFKETRKY